MKIRMASDFNQCNAGLLKETHLKKAFNAKGCAFILGRFSQFILMLKKYVDQVSIISFGAKNVVKTAFPKNKYGTFPGCSWKIPFDTPVEQASLSYKVFVPCDFDFVKGGKLPGLAGGSANSGGDIPNGMDGWSVRFMFKEKGTLCAYLYHVGMVTEFGVHAFLTYKNAPILLESDAWNTIELKIKMNDPEKSNGEVHCSLNRKEGLVLKNICFRKTNNLKIDQLLFSCFMGGDDSSYAPLSDQFLLFKDFTVEY
jgi:hypothetical protein